MIDYVLIDAQPYCTAQGAHAYARRAGWRGAGGGAPSLDTILRRLARRYGTAVLWKADDGVVMYTLTGAGGGKVRLRTSEPQSEEANWLIGRFRKAAGRA
jgi:hypothetical protein